MTTSPVAIPPTMSRRDIAAEIRLLRGWPARVGFVLFLVAVLVGPLMLSSTFLLTLLVLSAITCIGAIGLNLTMGYAGQLSLGHSAFLAVGAYTAAWIGIDHQLPFLVWVPVTALVTGLLGAFVGLFTLRLRGPYLAIVSIGLVFFFIYLFNNWESVSGGPTGRASQLPMSLGFVDFNHLVVGGTLYGREQGLSIICWLLVGLCLLIVRNMMRSGFGRAVLTVRGQDVAAEVLGVRPFRTKVVALAVGSAMAGVSGALLVNEIQYVLPSGFDLNMSIQFVAIIVLGGMGTTWGPVLGSIFITAIPQLLNIYADRIPFVKVAGEPGFGITKDNVGVVLYGVLIVLTLLAIPEGLVGLGRILRSLIHRVRVRPGGNPPKEMDAP
jgi:branched-chain amino acid transport system permease protein